VNKLAFIPPATVFKLVKKNGPKIIDFTVKNWPIIVSTATTAAATGKKVVEENKKRKELKIQNQPISFRKQRLEEFKNEIAPALELNNRYELTKYKLEIKQTLQQLEDEQKTGLLKLNKSSKQIKQWQEIYAQITVTLSLQDYHGLLSIYHKPDTYLDYFDGYEAITERLKALKSKGDQEEIKQFIKRYTGQSDEQIMVDFVLEESE